MEQSQLLAHFGSSEITREELKVVPTPAGSATHQPLPHFEIVGALVETLSFRQISVVREEYAVTGDGMKMFGVLDLETTFDGCRFSIGVRNSNDKSMRLALTVGYRVLVCDNMAFHGDFTPVTMSPFGTAMRGSRKMIAMPTRPISILWTRLRMISRFGSNPRPLGQVRGGARVFGNSLQEIVIVADDQRLRHLREFSLRAPRYDPGSVQPRQELLLIDRTFGITVNQPLHAALPPSLLLGVHVGSVTGAP